MRIEQMTIEDYEKVASLWQSTEGIGLHLDDVDSAAGIGAYLERNPDLSFVARDNGTVIGANTAVTLTPSDVGDTSQNWLGRSQYVADGYYNGLLDDFRIYNYALSHGEILSTAGMGTLYVPVTSPSNVYDLEPATQQVVNFKDYAKLVLMWLEENEWP